MHTEIKSIVAFGYSINETTQFRGGGISTGLKARLFIQPASVIATIVFVVRNKWAALRATALYRPAEITSQNGTDSNSLPVI